MKDSAASTARNESLEKTLLLEKFEPIAIVGIGLRLPGSNNSLAEFAGFLRDGRSGIVPIPSDRWNVEALHSDEPATDLSCSRTPVTAIPAMASGNVGRPICISTVNCCSTILSRSQVVKVARAWLVLLCSRFGGTCTSLKCAEMRGKHFFQPGCGENGSRTAPRR